MTYGKFIDDQKFKIEWTFDGIEHSIDFIVTNNRGKDGSRATTLLVSGVKGKDKIYLRQSGGLEKVTEEISLRIPDSYDKKGNNICIYFNMPDDYKVN